MPAMSRVRASSASRVELVRRNERVLGVTDRGDDGLRRQLLRVDALALHQALDEGEQVVLVIDGELRRASHQRRVHPHQAGPDGVEGAHPHAGGLRAEEATRCAIASRRPPCW